MACLIAGNRPKDKRLKGLKINYCPLTKFGIGSDIERHKGRQKTFSRFEQLDHLYKQLNHLWTFKQFFASFALTVVSILDLHPGTAAIISDIPAVFPLRHGSFEVEPTSLSWSTANCRSNPNPKPHDDLRSCASHKANTDFCVKPEV